LATKVKVTSRNRR